ncbi:ABC transporter permease [Phyllobacterium sophorae]|uniref:ABC transporter permease n=1 Tax=Phyllobacterium sophorae TaxID=1520277 RepID=A0A2P7AQ58_9HYPH|nr:ABC transporter permease [Phyllobacterium sophorae]PSH56350.1 ABC transporter permease [Phyllobacterium sophorae]
MFYASMSALLSHWRRRPMQLAMLLMGLSLATALWSGVQAINAEARASYNRAASMLGQDRLEQLVSADGETIPQQVFVDLRRAGWLVSPVLEGQLRLGAVRLHVFGIEPVSLPHEAQQVDLAGGDSLLPFITPPGLLYVSPGTVEQLAGQQTPPLRIAKDLLPGIAITDIGIAQSLLGKPGQISRLIVSPDQPVDRATLARTAPQLTLKKPDPEGDLARLTDSFHLNLTAFGFLAFAVGLFMVYSAIGLAFEQRRSTFRTLRSLGLSTRSLTGLLLTELIMLALVAGVAGLTLGYLVASLLLPGVAATLQGLYGASIPGVLTLRPTWWATGLGIAVFGTLLSAAQSLWRIWRMPLLAPAQPRAWARASEATFRTQAIAAITLFALTLALACWSTGLIAGFFILGGLLLGAALMLPVLLALFLLFMQRWSVKPVTAWFWADTRQQLPGLSLALMALLLALSANVGVGTMVSSFRLTFTGWLDQRLAAELYVTARTETEASALRQWLTPRVDAILPVWNVEGDVQGQPVQIFGVADDATYRDNWPLLQATSDVWDRVARGEAALVNEQLSRRDHLNVGDPLILPGGWTTVIAGVYSDYGNPTGQVIVGIAALTSHYPDVPRLRYGLRMAHAKVAGVRSELRKQFNLPEQNVVDQTSLKRRSIQIFEQTFAVTAALNVLTLGVAGLAMFASLMTLSGMRLPQLAPAWAMGLTRRQLVLLELARAMVLVVITLLAALPVGIGLAWVLLAIVNVEAFGWRLPMLLFPADWLRLGVSALAAALLSALIPLWRLARVTPTDLLKVFANER